MQEQHAEQRALLGGAEPHRLLPVENLERAENPELHHASDEDAPTVPLA